MPRLWVPPSSSWLPARDTPVSYTHLDVYKRQIVTNRWQTFTRVKLTKGVLDDIAGYCDEFLVHGVDVEGKAAGIEEDLVSLLGRQGGIPITYAGGIGSLEDLNHFRDISGGSLDFTIGSALDLFGGDIPYEIVAKY